MLGINVKTDKKAGIKYAELIVAGLKTYESRDSDSLRAYVGKRVCIVRTGEGKAKAIGEVTVGFPIIVNKKQFHKMQSLHLVPKKSQFDIKNTKYLYPMLDVIKYETEYDVGLGIIARKVFF